MKTLLVALLLSTTSIFASEVSVVGRFATSHCGSYFSVAQTFYRVSYSNGDLPWGTIVQLVYGQRTSSMNGGDEKSWVNEKTAIMVAQGPYTWEFNSKETLIARGNARKVDGLDFVFRIILPNNEIIYDKGSETELGHYSASLQTDLLQRGGTCGGKREWESEVFKIEK